jgi:hypothetical protein
MQIYTGSCAVIFFLSTWKEAFYDVYKCKTAASLLKLDPDEELLDSNVVMRLPEQTVEQMSWTWGVFTSRKVVKKLL